MARIHHIVRKAAIAVAGSALIAIGVMLLVLPGPGLVVIAFGLFVLSLEFEWAQRRLDKLETEAKKLSEKFRRR